MMILLALLLAAGDPLQPFLAEKAKDGTPVLTEAQRKKLEALPQHTRDLIGTAGESMILSNAKHLGVILSLDLQPQALEVVLQDNCILCHSDPGNVKPRVLFSPDPARQGSNPLLNLKEFVSDTHFRRGLSCSGCHGGKPTDEMMTKEISTRWPSEPDERHKDRSWIPEFCARCHADPAFMRGFNPAMPTDQLAKYRESRHGQLLLGEKDSRAAQCISCHGVHGIRGPKSRSSKVYPQNIPETCGACHADPKHMAGFTLADGSPMPTTQLAEYKQSVHGKALLVKGDLGAPACNGCHGNHAAMPPAVASVSQVCRTCHAQNGALFDGSKHKKAFEQHKWPECGQCHGKHAITKVRDDMIGDTSGTICQDCHVQYSKDNPACAKTAAHFRTTLDALAKGERTLSLTTESLAEKGLDVEPLATTINELQEQLVQSRARIHSFDQSTFDAAADPAKKAVEKGEQLVTEARSEVRFRRNGLAVAISCMGLLALALHLKIRQIGKRRG